ncbi:MAG: radical SAM protein [Candidatus Omnitrophota bacterium]
MVDTIDKVLFEGLTVCWRCGKAVKGKMILRGEKNLNYLIYDCPKDGVYEHLLGKEKFSYLDLISQKIPAYWPRWEPQLGMKWDDTTIINRENLPVLVFAVTTKCNSSCKICSLSEFNNMPSNNLDINFIKDKLSYYKGKEVILCGGEVTTREDLPELIKVVKKSGNIPVLQTNGLRLADKGYVRKLKKMGINHVHFSFDGFKEKIYEKIRGGKHEYNLKLTALDNLVKEKIRVSLTTVIIKGINEDQISKIISYAYNSRYIIEIAFLCFCLTPTGQKNGFTPDNILSSEEVKKIAAEYLCISEEDFLLWDEFKTNLAVYLGKLKSVLPFLPAPVFLNGMIYFKRGANGISPLLNKKELNTLIFALKNNKFGKLFTLLGAKTIKMILRNCFVPHLSEDMFYYKENMFKISVISPLNTYCFSPTSLTSFGFYDPNIGLYNKIHQR